MLCNHTLYFLAGFGFYFRVVSKHTRDGRFTDSRQLGNIKYGEFFAHGCLKGSISVFWYASRGHHAAFIGFTGNGKHTFSTFTKQLNLRLCLRLTIK